MGARGWRGFRSVLCPIDFSVHSRIALRYAAALAARSGGALTVLYANDPLLVAAAAAALHDRDIASRSGLELRRFVRQAIPASLKRPAKLQVCVGSPAKEILKAAARGVDLIVMATHGLTGAERLLLGSTTLSVLQRTPVPVLAVPPLVGDRASAIESWPGPCIVAACELDARTRGEADTAARVAEWLGATLVLAHVVPGIDAPAWLGGTLDGHDRIRIARAERLLDAAATVASRRVHTQAMVGCGRPADEIAALAADEGARLVVTTLRDRHGWFGARRGSVSHHVLTHAVVPVLACPASWRPR